MKWVCKPILCITIILAAGCAAPAKIDSDSTPEKYPNAVAAAKRYSELYGLSKMEIYERLRTGYITYTEDAAKYAVEHLR